MRIQHRSLTTGFAVLLAGALITSCRDRLADVALQEAIGVSGLPAPARRVVVLQSTAHRVPRIGCSGWELSDTLGFTPDSAAVALVDTKIVAYAESLFTELRKRESFAHLPPAGNYIRYYAGLDRPNSRVLYVHAVEPGLLGVPGFSMTWAEASTGPIAVCDGGSGVFGLFVDLDTGALGRLEFAQSFAGAVRY